MRIEVHCAFPLEQLCVVVDLPEGASVAQAVGASALLDDLPDDERARLVYGVWGRVVGGDFILEEGDRVELLRPLIADPKEARRRRAAKRGA